MFEGASRSGWSTIWRSLATVYGDVSEEHLFVFAAGLSYYFMLSMFPLLISVASLLAYLPIPHVFDVLLAVMARVVPGDGMSLVRSIIHDVVTQRHNHFLSVGLVFTIWTASSGFAATIDGLNVVYRVRETRPIWKTRPIALGLTVLAGSLLLLAVILMIEGTQLGQWFSSRYSVNPATLGTWRALRLGIAIIFSVIAVQLLYHFGPNLRQRFRDSMAGAIVAVTTWIGLSVLLGTYFRNFENLDNTYGRLGAAIGLYVWLYLSGFAVLLGGEINYLRSRAKGNRAWQLVDQCARVEDLNSAA